ncbi:MAG: DUF4037 domain-containing protein [Clostridia bacterium]|nr:DUF4037 domain-containing protein [Clostridia bacterium]
MKGLELAKRFFDECGKPMLETQFADVLPYIAVGLVGSGSECYGYDDDISRDHDFEPGFCIFIPDENVIDRKVEFELERAYAKLPKEFCNFKRSPLNPVGGNRHGVIRIGDFYASKTGTKDANLCLDDWFNIPEYALAEAVNGEIFIDNYGEFSRIRENLRYYPEDVRRKKIAGQLLLMAQSGQYNYNRCISRGDTAAAQLAVFEFVKSAMSVIFLLNKKYMPYYKWSFRALTEMENNFDSAQKLEFLMTSGNDSKMAKNKAEIIEKLCTDIVKELNKQGISNSSTTELEQQAYSVNNSISDNEIRNEHIFYAV